MGINPVLSDLNTPQTSKLGLGYFEANKIDRNELQIRKNLQKGTGTKMAEKLNNVEKFERKKNQISTSLISTLFSTQRPPDDWLLISKYTKFGKTSENLLLSQELSYTKIPLCYFGSRYSSATPHTLEAGDNHVPRIELG